MFKILKHSFKLFSIAKDAQCKSDVIREVCSLSPKMRRACFDIEKWVFSSQLPYPGVKLLKKYYTGYPGASKESIQDN